MLYVTRLRVINCHILLYPPQFSLTLSGTSSPSTFSIDGGIPPSFLNPQSPPSHIIHTSHILLNNQSPPLHRKLDTAIDFYLNSLYCSIYAATFLHNIVLFFPSPSPSPSLTYALHIPRNNIYLPLPRHLS